MSVDYLVHLLLWFALGASVAGASAFGVGHVLGASADNLLSPAAFAAVTGGVGAVAAGYWRRELAHRAIARRLRP